MVMRMSALRSQACCPSRCQSVSGFCTTPMPEPATVSRRYSSLSGGCASGSRPLAGWPSSMGCGLLLLDAVGEQQIVDALGQLAPLGIDGILAVAVELALDLARVWRQQQNAVADQGRLRNRMRHEQHGEAGIGPQLQQLVLHLAPGESIEGGKRLVPHHPLPLHSP